MASMNLLGFSLNPQQHEHPSSHSASQEHSQKVASHLSSNSEEGISGDCFDLTPDHSNTAYSLNLHPFGIFEAFNRNNSIHSSQDWNMKGLGSNSDENYNSQNFLLGTSCSSNQNLDNNNNNSNQQHVQPKLENFLGRHNFGDHGNSNCLLQLPSQPTETSTSSSSSSIGLSMIKTWLRNQPPPHAESDSDINNININNETCGSAAPTPTPLSLSMTTGSQYSSSQVQHLMGKNVGGESSSSDNKTSTTPALDGQTGAIETAATRKSIDTFGQRTSIYRGVTRHRWTGRYEAHLWDNSCRREGQTRKGRQVYLGGYDKEEKAARAYDLAALKYWGTTTTTNFPISHYEKELEEMKHMTRQEYVASLRRKSSGFSRGASIYRGVTRHHQHGRWQARIGRVAGNKDLYLGTFSTQEEAAEAYDIAAIKFRGLNAVTNFDMSRYDVKSILESSTLPIGGAAKRLKDVEQQVELLTVDSQRTEDDDSIISSHLTNGVINNYGANHHATWPALAFQHPHQPCTMHYPYGQRLSWCKQEQDSDDASHTYQFQDIHQLQLGMNTHNFFHSNPGLHGIMSMDSSASMDNGPGSNSLIYCPSGGVGGDGNSGNGYGDGYVIPLGASTTTNVIGIANDGNQNQRSNCFGENHEVKTLGYENVFGSGTDPYHARNLYYFSQQQSSADAVKANAYDQAGSSGNAWVPTAVPALAQRPTNMAFCPGAPPFTLMHE